jgi:hypothetical protein
MRPNNALQKITAAIDNTASDKSMTELWSILDDKFREAQNSSDNNIASLCEILESKERRAAAKYM